MEIEIKAKVNIDLSEHFDKTSMEFLEENGVSYGEMLGVYISNVIRYGLNETHTKIQKDIISVHKGLMTERHTHHSKIENEVAKQINDNLKIEYV